ncbi:MAG: hypothetical protein ABW185_27580, partial [Sedimenticola sp.]
QGCCCERTGRYSPRLLKRCYCTPYGTDFLRSYRTTTLSDYALPHLKRSFRGIQLRTPGL